MNTIKQNAHMITRLIITHIAMSVFGLVMFMATNLQKPATIMLFTSIASFAFFCVLSYTTMWEFGAKDKPAYDAGRRTNAAKCGFLVSLTAEAFWIVLAIAYAIIAYFDINIASIIYVVEIFTTCFSTGIHVFLTNEVLPKDSALTPLVIAGVYICSSLIVSLVNMFGYVLGTKDITIIPRKTAKK